MNGIPEKFFFNKVLLNSDNHNETNDDQYLAKSYRYNCNRITKETIFCHRICKQKTIQEKQIRACKLMKEYINGNTKHFTNDDWLYLIIKMGKRNFNKNKFSKYKLWCNHVDYSILLQNISRLQPLRHELERICSVYITTEKLSCWLQYHNINNEKISEDQLQNIINKAKSLTEFKVISNHHELSEHKSVREWHNPFFAELVISCYKKNTFIPRNFEQGRILKKEIDNIKLEHPTEEHNIIALLKNKNYHQEICGSRTLQLINKATQECFYLKFQRKNENWCDFIKEKNMHVSLAKLKITEKLKSEIPISQCLFKIPKNIANFKFNNRLEKYKIDNKKYVSGYCFKASCDYVNYVGGHSPEAIKNLFLSENGLKKAIADIAKLASYGLTFDSMIEAYHGTINCRPWSAMDYIDYRKRSKNDARYPISMSLWVSQNKKSDISYSGIRDLGDSTFFNYYHYNSIFNEEKQLSHYPENINEIIIYVRTLLDNIVAIVILYAHGKRHTPNYNFKNPKIISEVQKFIEECFNIFLQEYYETNTVSVKSILKITNENYNQWLKRASEEIVYWTMKQPEIDCHENYLDDDHIAKITKDYEFSYVKDVLQTGFLDTELYPDQKHGLKKVNLHPILISELSLGATHGPNFPFKALINGFSLILSEILLADDN